LTRAREERFFGNASQLAPQTLRIRGGIDSVIMFAATVDDLLRG
jgi:hypothetical protein